MEIGIDSIPAPLLVCGDDGFVLEASSAAAEILGAPAAALRGQPLENVLEPIPALSEGSRFRARAHGVTASELSVSVHRAGATWAVWLEPCPEEMDQLRHTADAWRYMADAGSALASAQDTRSALRAVAALAVPRVADWCIVELVDPETLRSEELEIAHADPAKIAATRLLRETYPPSGRADSIWMTALRTGRSKLIPVVPESAVALPAMTEEHRRLALSIGLRSVMWVPMVVGQRTLGLISFASSESGRTFGPDDLLLAEEIGRRGALALSSARHLRQAEEAIHLRDVFLTLASHELKTPLTALHLQAEGLARQAGSQSGELPALRRRASLVAASGRRLAALVDRLLDASILSSGPLRSEPGEVKLCDLTRKLVATFQPELERARCQVNLVATAAAGTWDPLFVEEIISNLLSNALRFGAGKVIDVSVRSKDGQALVTVADQGIGIASTDQERIFQRFERGVSERHYGGLGLGLWISRNLAESMGGKLRVESEPGRGAAFTLSLPHAS